jgi:uncharacterized RDD family membrane protein YckC
MEWYYSQAGVPAGPVSERDFQGMMAAGALNADTLIWHRGLPAWQRYGEMIRRGAFFAQPSADGQTPEPVWHYFCAECGRPFTADQLIGFGTARICGACKPIFYQRLREGAPLPRVTLYANFLLRMFAWLIDYFIMMAVTFAFQMLMIVPMALLMDENGGAGGGPPVFVMVFWALSMIIGLALPIGYKTWFVGRFGATPGKMALGLQVIHAEGSRLTYLRALGRAGAEMLSQMTLYIGYLIAAFDDEKRTLHDRLADTRVVKVR